jgi:putative endonuclease
MVCSIIANMKKMPKTTSYKKGVYAEKIAVLLLSLKFYRIIAKRYKTQIGEVDIIAVRGKTVIFIEVKKRASLEQLFNSINIKQQKRVINAAELFLSRNRQYQNYVKRFDAILITPKLLPLHIKNAWGR